MFKQGRMRWAGHVAHMGVIRNMQKFLVGKPEGKRPHRRPSFMWYNNIKIDVEIWLEMWTCSNYGTTL
jgi:hypothetical protein